MNTVEACRGAAMLLGALSSFVPIVSAREPAGAAGGAEWREVVTANTDVFRQSVTFRPGATTIVIDRDEKADARDARPAYSAMTEYDAGIFVSAVAWRNGGDQLFVAGVTPDGDHVIDRWDFVVREGQWILRPAATAPTIGAPASRFRLEQSVAGGGAPRVPPPGTPHVAPERTRVAQGMEFGVQSMSADPEGRFLLLLTDPDERVLCLDPSSPEAPSVVRISRTLDHLRELKDIRIKHYEPLGRVAVLTELGDFGSGRGKDVTMLIDGDNDGTFESDRRISVREWLSDASLVDPTNWSTFDRP